MNDNLKVAVIGLNGIGSYFVRSLSETIKKDIQGIRKINPLGIDLIDYDTIEEKNLAYTVYDIEHIGENKAKVLADITGYKAIQEKIESLDQLKGYDFIILAVDNNKVRNLVYDSNKPFLDLRAKGSGVLAFLTQKQLDTDKEYLKVTENDNKKGGCQYDTDVEENNIEFGNRVVAEIGLQMLKQYLQGDVKQKQHILLI